MFKIQLLFEEVLAATFLAPNMETALNKEKKRR